MLWQQTEGKRSINPGQLPQVYGRTRCEPDPACLNFVSLVIEISPCKDVCMLLPYLTLYPQMNMEGNVPPEYYLTHATKTSKEDMERLVVSMASSSYKVESSQWSSRGWLSGEKTLVLFTSWWRHLLQVGACYNRPHNIGFGWFQKVEAAAEDMPELVWCCVWMPLYLSYTLYICTHFLRSHWNVQIVMLFQKMEYCGVAQLDLWGTHTNINIQTHTIICEPPPTAHSATPTHTYLQSMPVLMI